MQVAPSELRDRMAARTSAELHAILADSELYTPAARDAARVELEARPSSDTASYDEAIDASLNVRTETGFTRFQAGFARIPGLLRGMFWVAVVIAVALSAIPILTPPAQRRADDLRGFVIFAVICWTIAAGIVTERAFVQPVLILLALGFALYALALSAFKAFSWSDLIGIAWPLWLGWNFWRDPETRNYYRRLRQG